MKLTAFLSEIAQIKEIDLWPHFWVSYWLAVEIVALKKQAIAYNRACSFTVVNFANICQKIARVFLRLLLVPEREVLYSDTTTSYKVSP
jgi:hypothetical protein